MSKNNISKYLERLSKFYHNFFFEKIIFENFNIFENNIISFEVAKVLR